jgi:hypothetical protein
MRQDLDKKPVMPTDRKVPELGNLEHLPFKVRQSQDFSVLRRGDTAADVNCLTADDARNCAYINKVSVFLVVLACAFNVTSLRRQEPF